MKRALILTLLLTSPVWAEQAPETPFISVTGMATTEVEPDLIVWSIILLDRDRDIRAAKQRNDERFVKLFALKDDLDIADEDFETGYVRMQQQTEPDNVKMQQSVRRQGDKKREEFVISRQITIRQRDLNRFDEFLDKLVSTEAHSASFTFDTSRREEIVEITRLDALRDAKQKAGAMAEVVGSKLGRPLSIEGLSPSHGFRALGGGYPGAAFSTPTRFTPGELKITVTVRAKWALE